MEFPDLSQINAALVEEMTSALGPGVKGVRTVASPYRISPLGAHIDHQGGPVLGMTIGAYTLMAYAPASDQGIHLRSKNYPDTVAFDLNDIPEKIPGVWGYYVRGAALALKEKYPIYRGITGLLSGMLPGCGLSSSASVLLAYLHALAEANDIILTDWDYVKLTQVAENRYIGLKNGILDQTSIVFGEKDHLLHIDTRQPRVDKIQDCCGQGAYGILIAYSGYSRELTTTGYNTRVQECREAAETLSKMAGGKPATILSDVSESTFKSHGDKLDPMLNRRARHFFGEVQRVTSGLDAWQDGQLARFGRLMNESCNSSMTYYECGSPPVQDLQQIVSSTKGVWGSRFSGGGFGGCVVGFVDPSHAEQAVSTIKDAYINLHPEVADQAAVYLAHSVKGVHFL
jgi:galacturonokinase